MALQTRYLLQSELMSIMIFELEILRYTYVQTEAPGWSGKRSFHNTR